MKSLKRLMRVYLAITLLFSAGFARDIIKESSGTDFSVNTGYIFNAKHPIPADIPVTTDVTDWEIQLGAPMNASLVIADLNGDGIKEIIAATYGRPPNPYAGGQLFVKDIDGNDLDGWPFTTGSPFSCSPAVGDVDNDGDMEIAAGSWNSMYLFNHDGGFYDGWPVGNGINYSPTLADLDGDGDLEIIYPSGSILYVRHHDGSYYDGFPVTAPEAIGSPAVGDIDNDGELEIIGCTLAGPVGPDPYEIYAWKLDGSVMDGFPVSTSGVVKSTPALGDVDNDGYLEIVVAAYHTSNLDYIYCIDYQGNQLDGWPIRAEYCRLSSPALADIDGDDDLEIFIGGLDTSGAFKEIVYGYDHQGNSLDGWPVMLPHDGGVGNINSSPVVAEIDGDPAGPEIFVKTYYYIFGLNSDGSYIEGFPYPINDDNTTGTYSPSPALGDLDNDGDADFVFGSSSGRLYLVDGSGSYDAELSDWPMYKHDQWGLSRYGAGIETGIALDEQLPAAFKLEQNYPNPFNASTTIGYELSQGAHVSIDIYDILGRKIAEIQNRRQYAGYHQVIWGGQNESSGIYFYRMQIGDCSETIKMILLK